jgi:hypothetical protein
MNKCHLNTELSSLEGTRSEFNRSRAIIKLGIDVVTLLLELIFRRQPRFGGGDHGLEAGIVAERIEVWIDLGVV